MSLTLSVLPGEYAVSRLYPGHPVPSWALQGEFWTVSRSADELSVVCLAALVPDGVQTQKGWAALKLHGPFEFTLTGVLASVLNPLKDAGIGIFAVSTFDTDYVLVAQGQLAQATAALREAGLQVMDLA
ncbi:ACT domain-containing protein [Deinococcus cavernae]|uniref:ACT domain-containing protein n=1 Tax=Deinococcus cavernae TaxID=2320857 RepID=A0A418V624_9DEIO|nr:ACT domain-containing protein [Deinococcus cavernae]RJF71537.1 ACT domain-containing protein [Deinococcus cavernae]